MKPDNIIPIHSDRSVRADAVRNRRLLLDTALQLFDDNGIENVTMSAIAKEAGVGKGTLYRHFADKAVLCHALLHEDMAKFQTATIHRMDNCDDDFECLQWFLEEAAKYVVTHNEMLVEIANQGGVDMLHHPAHIWFRKTISALLSRLNLDMDVSYVSDMLYIMLDVQTIRFQRQQGYDVGRIVNGLHAVLGRLLQ